MKNRPTLGTRYTKFAEYFIFFKRVPDLIWSSKYSLCGRWGSVISEETEAESIGIFPYPSANALCFLPVSSFPHLFGGFLCRFRYCAQKCWIIGCQCKNSLSHTVQTMGFCLSLSLEPFILQTHTGLCFQLPLWAGKWRLWMRYSGVNHKHSCHMFHLLRQGASFVQRNLIQPWLSKEAQKRGNLGRKDFLSLLRDWNSCRQVVPQLLLLERKLTSFELHQGLEGSKNSFHLALLLFYTFGKGLKVSKGYAIKLLPKSGFS